MTSIVSSTKTQSHSKTTTTTTNESFDSIEIDDEPVSSHNLFSSSVVHVVLPKSLHHIKTGRVHGLLLVDDDKNKQVVFQLQLGDHNSQNQTILTAARGNRLSKTAFVIYATDNNVVTDKQPSNKHTMAANIASLVQTTSNLNQHVYSLLLLQQKTTTATATTTTTPNAIAKVVYTVPSIVSGLLQSSSRQVELVLYETSKSPSQDGDKHHCEECPPSVTTLRSLEPHKMSNGKLGLDFCGRGRCSSRKNMQLTCVDGCDSSKVVVLQMAKWDDHVFHVDFQAPVTPLQAFGWALAQLDVK
jgi:hypothetical protein